MDYNNIRAIIIESLTELFNQDKNIFTSTISDNSYLGRKLHEVCINHRLAYYLERNICRFLRENCLISERERIYVDIEFNKRGSQQKKATISGTDNSAKIKIVRPDIIVHNRKDGDEKRNILIVEAKKFNINRHDKSKVVSLMTDADYQYTYGLTVSYCRNDNFIEAYLYEANRQEPERITVPNNT